MIGSDITFFSLNADVGRDNDGVERTKETRVSFTSSAFFKGKD